MTAPTAGVSAMMASGGFLTKHGFPPGYRFMPTGLELISLLSDKIDGAKLRPPHDSIFHDLPILAYHPKELHDRYEQDREHRYIYFFSQRAFQKQGTGGAIASGRKKKEDQKSPRPVRVARGGTWKASGCGKLLCWPRNKGGFVAGRVVTMVFYDHGGDKSNWGMHEFTVPVDKRLRLSSLPTKASYKYIRFRDLALYRLYILRSGDMEIENAAGSSSLQMLADANDNFSALSMAVAPPCLPVQPSWDIFAAGPSTTSQTPPPQHPGVDLAHYYHHQPAFAAAQQQALTMPVHGARLPGDSFQFASPPAPAPVPPAAANPAAHQTPATATHGAGTEASHFRATHSPCSPPVISSPPAEQHATATTEPAHAYFADCFKPAEEAAPPKLKDIMLTGEDERMGMADADENHGPGMPDWDLGFETFDDHSFQFMMEEILGHPAFGEPPATEGGSNSGSGGGGNNYSQPAGGVQQEPPAAGPHKVATGSIG